VLFTRNLSFKKKALPKKLVFDKKKKWHKSAKKQRIKIDRTEYRKVDRKTLPPDAEHNGYRNVVVQNIISHTDNVEYKLERFYSPCENKINPRIAYLSTYPASRIPYTCVGISR